ncbi:MAG TPA: type I polyketide synthase, partial [Polyangiaceae bacterium]|nr:type I polyketide synthase [Polyangiaceae bacterium]
MNETAIAVVGMAGRFPGARNIDELWRNVAEGRTALRRFLPDEVPEPMRSSSTFVAARPVLDDPLMFDAPFFDMSPREAALTDPQQRLLLECAWEALEHAGYDPARSDGLVGVYAGCDVSTYAPPNPLTLSHDVPAIIAFDKDYLATRISFKLNLRGPGITVQTACSTSLVAVQLACQGLLGFQCDMALAGGVSVAFPQTGYLHRPGGIFSPDGVCRPFEARAQGTVRGDGAGMVALKRLADALEARDTIHAVIRAAAINNDGADKMSYAAPSETGQVDVISLALALAGVDPETIGYMEAHGTGTELGDPIEVAALTRAWGVRRTRYCALGSLKANVGHMIAAAGIGGLIKAVLALEHAAIPPMPSFEAPNPRIDFDRTPFYIARSLEPWPRAEQPRRAAVSSFGIGGTNAHAVLEEAPAPQATSPARGEELVIVSARTAEAVQAASAQLAKHLTAHPEQELADVAYTLLAGRKLFDHRSMLVCASAEEATRSLPEARIVQRPPRPARVTFMFPGQGTQRVGMGHELYDREPVFRDVIDHAARVLLPMLGLDLRDMLYPQDGRESDAAEELAATRLTQPALLAVEVALARLWMSWGVVPDALIGHSLGELSAACIAEVMSFDDALTIVARRGELVGRLPRGAMLAIASDEELPPGVDVAAENAPGMRVVSGPRAAIVRAERSLRARGVACTRLRTSHAFHSSMLDPAVSGLEEAFREIVLHPPKIPFMSNVTGTWITDAQAVDRRYWGRQLREPVRFSPAAVELLSDPDRAFLEVGPGRVLCDLMARHERGRTLVPCLAGPERRSMLHALGTLYLADVPVDLRAYYAGERRRRVPLPTYPFERKLHAAEEKRDWLYVPTCNRVRTPSTHIDTQASWLLCSDGSPLGAALERRLQSLGARVRVIAAGGVPEDIDARYVVDLRDDFFGALALVRRVDHDIHVGLVTRGVVDVLGDERARPQSAMLLGLVRVLPQEAPNARAVLLDVADDPDVDAILAEICAASCSVVAFRGASRWTLGFEPLTAPQGASLLRERGTYLIAGLGTIGWTLAEHLARKQARLVLVQRSTLERTKVEHLEKLGA